MYNELVTGKTVNVLGFHLTIILRTVNIAVLVRTNIIGHRIEEGLYNSSNLCVNQATTPVMVCTITRVGIIPMFQTGVYWYNCTNKRTGLNHTYYWYAGFLPPSALEVVFHRDVDGSIAVLRDEHSEEDMVTAFVHAFQCEALSVGLREILE